MRFLALALLCGLFCNGRAQFHTLTMPERSPFCTISQQVGVTTMQIQYHSPAVRGRDVWNSSYVIPQKGNPIPWRAGANENTVISFDTDVEIEGQLLEAGSYGFHIIPNGHQHTLLFARPDNLWGSYYLDTTKHIVLKVSVRDTASAFNEYLSYSVINRTESSCRIALKWGERMIPFNVSVNLAKTAVAKWRYELNGSNTYQWEAWNDAASWCVEHNTNLEEALQWVNRSLEGGYGGFAAHRSFINLSTKVEILDALNREVELNEILKGLSKKSFSADEAHYMGATLLKLKKDKAALELMESGLHQHPNDWGMLLYKGVASYYLGKTKSMKSAFDACQEHCPERFRPRLAQIKNQMANGEYAFPQRKS